MSGLDAGSSLAPLDPAHEEIVVVGVTVTDGGDDCQCHCLRLELPARCAPTHSSATPAARVCRDLGGAFGWAGGEQLHDRTCKRNFELCVGCGTAFPVSHLATGSDFGVGKTGHLSGIQCGQLDQGALTFVAPSRPTEANDHCRKSAGLTCPPRQCGIPSRKVDEVVHVGTGQTDRSGVLHEHEVPWLAARGAGPIVEGVDDDKVASAVGIFGRVGHEALRGVHGLLSAGRRVYFGFTALYFATMSLPIRL